MNASLGASRFSRFLSALLATAVAGLATAQADTSTYIVQGASLDAARTLVRGVGAEPSRDLDIIHAVAAELTAGQLTRLRADSSVRVYEDREVRARGLFDGLKDLVNGLNSTLAETTLVQTVQTVTAPVVSTLTCSPLVSAITSPIVDATTSLQTSTSLATLPLVYETNYPAMIGADELQCAGVTGRGITIAVLDTGLWRDTFQFYGTRILATRDVTNGGTGPVHGDVYGHGTHVTSIAASGAQALNGSYQGIAPQANLVAVKAFDGTGAGRYVDVIAGIDWIVANRVKYKIRVLNLSFGATPQSFYWDDPLNQAVMAAWRAGIVVVVAAGNDGPGPMTINVPGNVPYVITVGALTDSNTPYQYADDKLASFSSTGPTFEGFVKPELVSPGGHIAASMSSSSYLSYIDPGSVDALRQLFTMSGTSQGAAVASGVVALMLQDDPSLTPDTVKCRLLATARPAVKTNGRLAYSVFQQGAGLLNARDAANSGATGCANRGLDVGADLAGTKHFGGPANQDDSGNYYIMDMTGTTWGDPLTSDGYTWSKGYPWGEGYAWSDGYTWSKGYTWSRGYTWSKGYTWSRGYTWSKGYTWSRSLTWWTAPPISPLPTKPASIATWVPNQ
jgi:serine protease AprX